MNPKLRLYYIIASELTLFFKIAIIVAMMYIHKYLEFLTCKIVELYTFN